MEGNAECRGNRATAIPDGRYVHRRSDTEGKQFDMDILGTLVSWNIDGRSDRLDRRSSLFDERPWSQIIEVWGLAALRCRVSSGKCVQCQVRFGLMHGAVCMQAWERTRQGKRWEICVPHSGAGSIFRSSVPGQDAYLRCLSNPVRRLLCTLGRYGERGRTVNISITHPISSRPCRILCRCAILRKPRASVQVSLKP